MVGFILKEKLHGFINSSNESEFDKALQKAFGYGYTEIVQCFKPYMKIRHHNSYIFDPAWYGQLRILKILITNPNEPLMVDSKGNNPHWSILSQKRHKVLKIDPFEINFLLFFLEVYQKVLGKPC